MKIAFAKGRGAADCMKYLKCDSDALPKRFVDAKSITCLLPDQTTECFIVRGSDIAWYLENRIVDIAIGSQLLFLNADNPDLEKISVLPFGSCRLSLLAKKEHRFKHSITIATRYPDLGKRLLADYPREIKWLTLTGCLETALLLDLCDAIIDVVETGRSMREYDMTEHRVLAQLSHGIWVNRHGKVDLSELQELLFVPELNPSTPLNDLYDLYDLQIGGVGPR